MKALKKLRLKLSFFVWIFLVIGGLNAQSNIGIQAPPYQTPALTNFEMIDFDFQQSRFEIDNALYSRTNITPYAFNSPLADDALKVIGFLDLFNHNALPFFCKIEFEMEQASGFPVKFRLGDVQLVDRLEGKTDYVAPVW